MSSSFCCHIDRAADPAGQSGILLYKKLRRGTDCHVASLLAMTRRERQRSGGTPHQPALRLTASQVQNAGGEAQHSLPCNQARSSYKKPCEVKTQAAKNSSSMPGNQACSLHKRTLRIAVRRTLRSKKTKKPRARRHGAFAFERAYLPAMCALICATSLSGSTP